MANFYEIELKHSKSKCMINLDYVVIIKDGYSDEAFEIVLPKGFNNYVISKVEGEKLIGHIKLQSLPEYLVGIDLGGDIQEVRGI